MAARFAFINRKVVSEREQRRGDYTGRLIALEASHGRSTLGFLVREARGAGTLASALMAVQGRGAILPAADRVTRAR
jgi:hypothetical protein